VCPYFGYSGTLRRYKNDTWEGRKQHKWRSYRKQGAKRVYRTDLEGAAEVMQGALGPQEAPGQDGADLLTHGVEMSDEAVGHLRRRGAVTEKTTDKHSRDLVVCHKQNVGFQPDNWTCTFMCCLLCFITDQQLDATACEIHAC